MKKVHVLPLGHHPQENRHYQTPLTSTPWCSPNPAAPLAPTWLVGWAGWVLGALPQHRPSSSRSAWGPPCPCRCRWRWGRRCAQCHHHPPRQSCFVQCWPGTSSASSPPHAPVVPPCRLPSRRSGRKAGPHQDGAQPQQSPHLFLILPPPPSPSSPVPSSSPWPPSRSHPPQTSHPTRTDPSWGGNRAAQAFQ